MQEVSPWGQSPARGGGGWELTWVGTMEPSRRCRLRCSRGADSFSISPLLFTEEPWAGGRAKGGQGHCGGSGKVPGSSHFGTKPHGQH